MQKNTAKLQTFLKINDCTFFGEGQTFGKLANKVLVLININNIDCLITNNSNYNNNDNLININQIVNVR